eukprot:726803-Rhodomonas_salina.5
MISVPLYLMDLAGLQSRSKARELGSRGLDLSEGAADKVEDVGEDAEVDHVRHALDLAAHGVSVD